MDKVVSMTNDVDIARALLAERGFRVPEIDLPDVCKAAQGLSQTVAREAEKLGFLEVDVDFAQTLVRLAPPALPSANSPAARGAGDNSREGAVASLAEALRRIDESGLGKLAWHEIDRDAAMACARALDTRSQAGAAAGLLQGVPVGVKDMFDRQGHVAGWGSNMRSHETPASHDATIVSRLRDAGAVLVGVQHMAEFAMSPTGLNAKLGPGRNPWNNDHVCGGSSSGGGMSVGAGHVPLAIGSDTGGSVRLPAAFCGVPGMKPTQYRVSLAGAMPLSPNLDTLGPLAESVALCGRALTALCGADARDPGCLEVATISTGWMTATAQSLTVAVPRLEVGPLLSADMLRVFQESVRTLRTAGVRCVDVDLPDLDLLGRMGSVMLAAESAAIHREWLRTRADDYGRQVRRRLSRGLLIAGMDYYDALRLRGPMLRRYLERTLAGADALLLPTIPDVAPRVADTIGDDETKLEQAFSALSFWTRGINYLGLPALSVPAGRGLLDLPLAVQFVGPPLGEDRILALGQVLEQHGTYRKFK